MTLGTKFEMIRGEIFLTGGSETAGTSRGGPVLQSFRNRVRGILHVRAERALPQRGPKPAIGRQIARGDVRMTVQAGFSDELWVWLMEQGWRELRYGPEQRRYRDIPATCVTDLIDAHPDERSITLIAAIARSACRPALGVGNVAAYVERH